MDSRKFVNKEPAASGSETAPQKPISVLVDEFIAWANARNHYPEAEIKKILAESISTVVLADQLKISVPTINKWLSIRDVQIIELQAKQSWEEIRRLIYKHKHYDELKQQMGLAVTENYFTSYVTKRGNGKTYAYIHLEGKQVVPFLRNMVDIIKKNNLTSLTRLSKDHLNVKVSVFSEFMQTYFGFILTDHDLNCHDDDVERICYEFDEDLCFYQLDDAKKTRLATLFSKNKKQKPARQQAGIPAMQPLLQPLTTPTHTNTKSYEKFMKWACEKSQRERLYVDNAIIQSHNKDDLARLLNIPLSTLGDHMRKANLFLIELQLRMSANQIIQLVREHRTFEQLQAATGLQANKTSLAWYLHIKTSKTYEYIYLEGQLVSHFLRDIYNMLKDNPKIPGDTALALKLEFEYPIFTKFVNEYFGETCRLTDSLRLKSDNDLERICAEFKEIRFYQLTPEQRERLMNYFMPAANTTARIQSFLTVLTPERTQEQTVPAAAASSSSASGSSAPQFFTFVYVDAKTENDTDPMSRGSKRPHDGKPN